MAGPDNRPQALVPMTERFSGRSTEKPVATVHVEGEEAASFDGKESVPVAPSRKQLLPEEIVEAVESVDELLKRYQKFLTTFAKDPSLRFKAGERFMIDLDEGIVSSDVRWFAERELTEAQIIWAHLHEITHFRDLAEDPKGMEKRFSYEIERACQTGEVLMQKWIEAAGSAEHPLIKNLKQTTPVRKDWKIELNKTEVAALKMRHTFFNILDDIWDNSSVARRAPRYASSTPGGEEVRALYQKKLFAATDYQKSPRHLQFLYTLLREEMVPGEEVQISDEVRTILDKPVLVDGEEYSVQQIVQKFIKPGYGRDTKISNRDKVIRAALEPIFDKLLAQDINDWKPSVPPPQEEKPEDKEPGQPDEPEEEPTEGEEQPPESESPAGEPADGEPEPPNGNPFEDEYKEFDENTLDQLDENEVKEWVQKKGEEMKKEAQAEAAPVRTQRETQAELDKVWLTKNQIDPRVYESFQRYERQIEPYLTDLSKFWRQIVYGKTSEVGRKMQGHFNTGMELDVQKAVDEFPRIERGEMFKTRTMKRMMPESVEVERPELIRVRLLGDVSGSMDEERMEVLRQCYVLILSSLNEFNAYLDLTRSATKSPLRADTEARTFGQQARIIKPLDRDIAGTDSRGALVKSFGVLLNSGDENRTNDGEALSQIVQSLTPEDRLKITNKKIMEIVFELTDGGSTDASVAREAITALSDMGVIVKAFQIGEPSREDKRTFDQVWNFQRQEQSGEFIGTQLKNVVPALTALLKKYLGRVVL